MQPARSDILDSNIRMIISPHVLNSIIMIGLSTGTKSNALPWYSPAKLICTLYCQWFFLHLIDVEQKLVSVVCTSPTPAAILPLSKCLFTWSSRVSSRYWICNYYQCDVTVIQLCNCSVAKYINIFLTFPIQAAVCLFFTPFWRLC